jgi:hypothetical protein
MIINGVRYALTGAVKAGLKTKYGQKQANKLIETLRTSDNVPKNVQNFITNTFTKTGRLANIPAPTPVRSGVPRAQAIKESARAREVAANARKTQKRLLTTAEVVGTGAVALQRDKKPADISPKAKKAMNKAAAAVSQSKIKNKPKPPFRNTNSMTTKALNQGLSAPPKSKFDPEGIKKRLASRKNGELKTSLRAARAAGDLYYKNPKTGRKMAAVLASDLKPGQTLTDYINKKEGKTPRAVRPRRKPTQKPRGL